MSSNTNSCTQDSANVTLGIDAGALAIKVFVSDPDGKGRSFYRLHKGNPEKTIVDVIGEIGVRPGKVAITGTNGRKLAELLGTTYVDPAVALVAAQGRGMWDVERGTKDVRHIIDIGGGSLSIVDLDEEGRFAGYRTNSLCAAGTGSFLDEQAARMKLSIDDMSAERNIENPPRIAARCAVFAKSDLIHRQQEGFSVSEMWSGLCHGMVTTALSTLFRGRKPKGKVLLAGGVALNREVVRWLRKDLNTELIVPEEPHTFSARGAVRAAKKPAKEIDWKCILAEKQEENIPRRPKLELTLSNYPSFECAKSYIDDLTEVRIHEELKGEVVIGIDIGSTSTKAAIVDMRGRVLADLYRRTSGEPIAATQKILAAISRVPSPESRVPGPESRVPGPESRVPSPESRVTVMGVGTTGSGRKMVGAIIGADRVINEITAHAKGAAASDPDIEAIFEIGGQDAKFVSLKEGVPHDSNMNYVCAAGTGSFVEEQANKLGFKLDEIGDAVMGAEPPYSSDRCTVFMEQDVHCLIRAGFERREVMGSVLYSVVQNYLNKVVGRRPYSRKKISFMGATARNKGLVAAFEKLIGAPIVVSPYCHVMGAFGVARIVLEEIAMKGETTAFRGLSFSNETVELKRDVCELCQNKCRVTRAVVGDSVDEANMPSWGYLCGRDPEEKRVRVNKGFDAFRKRDRLWKQSLSIHDPRSTIHDPRTTVGIPRTLLTYSNLPFWSMFFGELGAGVVLSKPTHEGTLASANDFIGSDYCYPVKLAHGHVRELAVNDDIDFIFLPYMVQGEPHDDGFKRGVYCPYNIALPSIIKTSGVADEKPIVTAALNVQLDIDIIVNELSREVGAALKVSKGQIKRAWEKALVAQEKFDSGCVSIGSDALAKIEENNGRGVVILGRPYNVHDLGANLNLPQKIADLGTGVLAVDMLPLKDVRIDPLFHNMYWRYGRKILQAATFVRNHPNLHAVFLTNFGCGPDSFLQSFVEKIMQGKPMLMLELDEHSADAGYITRLEAFRDVINKDQSSVIAREPHATEAISRSPRDCFAAPRVCRGASLAMTHIGSVARNDTTSGLYRPPSMAGHHAEIRTMWVPPMHPYGAPFLAAAMRSVGIPARPLPKETIETFEIAKQYCRGTECVPLPSTIGAFLNVLKKSDAPEREAFFMPSAKGPCRFGQYHTLHRMILDEAGFPNSPIEAWNDSDGGYGTDARTSSRLYNAIIASDLLFKARCRVRPYAIDRNEFDRTMEEEVCKVTAVIESCGDTAAALKDTANSLLKIKMNSVKKPLVGIVGEIYVRLNPFTNGELVKTIEEAGGEAWVAPISEWFQYLGVLDKMKARLERHTAGRRIRGAIKSIYMKRREKSLTNALLPIIGDRLEPPIISTVHAGERFFPRQFDGESIMTVGRALEFAEQGVDLIINCAPFGCMPGTLTSGIFQKIEGKINVPIVSLFFDGETDLRHLVRTYMENLKSKIPNPCLPAGRQNSKHLFRFCLGFGILSLGFILNLGFWILDLFFKEIL